MIPALQTRWPALVVVMLLAACDQPAPDVAINTPSTASSKSEQAAKPDTSRWVQQVNIMTGASYRNKVQACLYTVRAKELIETVEGIDPKSPFNVRLRVEQGAQHAEIDKLNALREAGILMGSLEVVGDKTTVNYQLSRQGWMIAGNQNLARLCVPIGRTQATRLTNYYPEPNQESGLEIYRADFVLDRVYEKWATKDLRKAFQIKEPHSTSRKLSLLFIKGPKGYYLTMKQGRLPRTYPVPRPTDTGLTDILRSDDDLLNDICSARFAEKISQQSCSAPALKKSLVAAYGGPARNQSIVVRFHNQASGEALVMGEVTMAYNPMKARWQRQRPFKLLH